MNGRIGNRQKMRKWYLSLLGLAAIFLVAELILAALGLPNMDSLLEEMFFGPPEPVATSLPVEGTLEVHILDVGQADCVLIRGSEQTILVDAGTADSAVSILAYLGELGITELDMIVSTHPHNDHFGGMRAVMEAVETKAVLMPPLSGDLVPTTVSYEKLVTYLAENDIPTSQSRVGDIYELGGGGRLTILGPKEAGAFRDLNNSSIVCRVDFGETSFLLTGDIEAAAESDLLARNMLVAADVLKAGHHGSRTSSSGEFFAGVSPRYVAISCGLDNDYGHPHPEVLQRYAGAGATVYRTDLDGAIVFVSDGATLTVTTAAEGMELKKAG